MSDTAVPIPVESPELEAKLVSVGSYLFSAATTFFFVAFLFAFFYLRALDSNGLWGGPKPGHHVSVPTGSGVAILVCVLVSVALAWVAHRMLVAGHAAWWTVAGIAFLIGLAAVAIQSWQYTDLGFGTEDGGYASVYLGWTAFFSMFALGAMLWLEVILATARRASTRPAADVVSFAVFWTTLGVVQVAAFVLLFGVK